MRFEICHESEGRIRLKGLDFDMSINQADTLEAYISNIDGVSAVTIHERTQGVIITYSCERKILIEALSAFSYDKVSSVQADISHSSRALAREYKEKIIWHVIRHYLKKLYVPMPIRRMINTVKAVPYIYYGLRELANRRVTVEVLDGAAITTSMLMGDFSTAGSVMFLLKLGDLLDEWTHKKSIDDLAKSMALNVDNVWLEREDGTRVMTPLDEIREGDLVAVGTGHVVPLDGTIVRGDVMLNQASLTGESVPVAKMPGALVYAGSVVEEGSLVFRVSHSEGGSKYDRIVRMIEDSEKLKSGVENRASNLADKLVPWCLLGSLVTYIITKNLTRAVSVLMVDFSCALKLSMPLSVLSAMKEAGKHKITVKGGKYMEKVSEAGTLIFDKTGTLTRACPRVIDVIPFDGQDPDEMLRVAACMEEHFPHSMANAVVREARERHLDHEEMHSEVEYIVAHGIATRIGRKKALIGSHHFVFEDEKTVIPRDDRKKFNSLDPKYSYLYLAIGGRLSAAICIADPLRPEAPAVVRELHEAGIGKIVMLTGDSLRTAEAIAGEVGVDDFMAEVLPEDKAEYIKSEQLAGRTVIMVGDGINDAPALSLADVGIAIGDGATIAREVADITIQADNLSELLKLKRLSDLLMKRIHRNYRFVMGFNGGLMGLGALGILSPATSALLHNSSTILLSADCMTDLDSKK